MRHFGALGASERLFCPRSQDICMLWSRLGACSMAFLSEKFLRQLIAQNGVKPHREDGYPVGTGFGYPLARNEGGVKGL